MGQANDLRYIYTANPAQPKSRGCIQAIPKTAHKSLEGTWDLQRVLQTLYYTHDSYTGGRKGNYENTEPHYCVFHEKAKQDKEKNSKEHELHQAVWLKI